MCSFLLLNRIVIYLRPAQLYGRVIFSLTNFHLLTYQLFKKKLERAHLNRFIDLMALGNKKK